MTMSISGVSLFSLDVIALMYLAALIYTISSSLKLQTTLSSPSSEWSTSQCGDFSTFLNATVLNSGFIFLCSKSVQIIQILWIMCFSLFRVWTFWLLCTIDKCLSLLPGFMNTRGLAISGHWWCHQHFKIWNVEMSIYKPTWEMAILI